jgi:hypothetical protein
MNPDVLAFGAQRHKQVEAGKRRGTRAGGDDLRVLELLAGQFNTVENAGRDDDGGAVLVIMEDRNVHDLAQLLFDLEAFGRLDVFQIDAAKGRLKRRNHADHAVHVRCVDLDIEDIDACEFLEQDRLALHHRLGGERTDVAKAREPRCRWRPRRPGWRVTYRRRRHPDCRGSPGRGPPRPASRPSARSRWFPSGLVAWISSFPGLG